jgi:hypothetical protein
MSIDTRARRAADGARASVTGVNPMAALTELKQTDTTRRRHRGVALAASAAVVAAFALWIGVGMRGAPSSAPPAAPAPSPSVDTREIVGTGLVPGMQARVPVGWDVESDAGNVWLAKDGLVIQSLSTIDAVADPATDKVTPVPADLAAWLRSHPWLGVTAERSVEVDGQQADLLTFATNYTARSAGSDPTFLRLARATQIPTGNAWTVADPGTEITWVIVPRADGDQLVLAFGATTPELKAELASALDEYLASINLV